MRYFILLIITSLLLASCGNTGCSDPAACNYDSEVVWGDESCFYYKCKKLRQEKSETSIRFFLKQNLGGSNYLKVLIGSYQVGRLDFPCQGPIDCDAGCQSLEYTDIEPGNYQFRFQIFSRGSTPATDSLISERKKFVPVEPGCNAVTF